MKNSYRQSGFSQYEKGVATLRASGGDLGGGSETLIIDSETYSFEPGIAKREGGHYYKNVSGTLRANAGDNQMAVAIANNTICYESHPEDSRVKRLDNTSPSVTSKWAKGSADTPLVLKKTYQSVTGPLMANSHPGSYSGQDAYTDMFVTNLKGENEMPNKTNVRRLTPLECERLQGFPDNWTLIGKPKEIEVKDYDYEYDIDGNIINKTLAGIHKEIHYFYTDENGKQKECTDSARYKALGNSIALPFWFYLLRRIAAQYERPATMGSLFDGIGGFPLAWESCNGRNSARWASEIEPFPIAVTKQRFPED